MRRQGGGMMFLCLATEGTLISNMVDTLRSCLLARARQTASMGLSN